MLVRPFQLSRPSTRDVLNDHIYQLCFPLLLAIAIGT